MGMILDRTRHSSWGMAPISPSMDRFGQSGSGSPVPVDCLELIHTASRPLRSGKSYLVFIDEEKMDTNTVSTPWPLLNHFYTLHAEPSAIRDQIRDHCLYYIRHSTPLPASDPKIVTPHEQLAEVTHTFSLNAPQLAAIFGVSRQTIYNWRKDETIAAEYRPRLISIHGLVQHYRQLDSTPIGTALLWVETTSGKSLLDLLIARPHDHATIRRYLNALPTRILEHFTEANAAIERNKNDGFDPIPDRWRLETRRAASALNLTKRSASDL